MIALLFTATLTAASPVGTWQTIDDSSGKPRSHVQIEEKNGKLQGKIVHLIDPDEPNPLCDACPGPKKNAPILGLQIMWDLTRAGDAAEWTGGSIMDPENGKTYDCKIWLEGEDTLKVRGSWLFLGRTQTWRRVSSRP